MQDSINDKIATNVGLIFKQLKKFHLAHDPEAESIGYEALYNAVLTYTDNKNTKFSTYASVCIYNALGTYVRTLNKQRQLEVISYNNIAYSDNDVEHEFIDFFAATKSTEDDLVRAEIVGMVRCEIQQLYGELTNDKHKSIIMLWIKSKYAMPMSHIAKQVGVSQPYVSQVVSNFKHRLKSRLEDYYYD